MAISRSLLFVVTLLVTACAGSNQYEHYAEEYDPRKHPYVIGTGDTLSVHVWKDPELSTETIVRPDGTITVPLIGDVKAEGKSPDQVRDEISDKVSEYVKNTIVTVAVSEVASYHFTVTGEVAHPGVFGPSRYVSVAEALALAGGPTRYADMESIVVIRDDRKEERPRRIPIDYEAILEGDAPEQNIAVLRGDTLYVP